MELEQVLGEVLRSVRKKRGLSQEALAFDAGIERNYVSLIELGKNSASVRILFKLCSVLEVSPSELFARVEEQIATKKPRKHQARRALKNR